MQVERGRKAWVEILVPDKMDFKTKAIVQDKERHYIMIKGTIQQENITLANIYAPNIGAPKYVNQILMDMKGRIDRNRGIVRDFNTTLTLINRSSMQKINKEAAALNNKLDHMYLIDIFRAFHCKAEYTIVCCV